MKFEVTPATRLLRADNRRAVKQIIVCFSQNYEIF